MVLREQSHSAKVIFEKLGLDALAALNWRKDMPQEKQNMKIRVYERHETILTDTGQVQFIYLSI